MCGPILRMTQESKGEREGEAEETKNAKNTTHTNPIQSILTLVARWTTPIESPRERLEVESRSERSVLRMEVGEGERVGYTRISLT